MPATVERLTGEPIVIIRIDGGITVDDIRTMLVKSISLTRGVPGIIYRIIDLSRSEHNLETVITHQLCLKERDMRFFPVVIGSIELERELLDGLIEHGCHDVKVPVFRTINDALSHIRVYTSQNQWKNIKN